MNSQRFLHKEPNGGMGDFSSKNVLGHAFHPWNGDVHMNERRWTADSYLIQVSLILA